MRAIGLLLTIIIGHHSFAQYLSGFHGATVKHVEFGLLEGDIGPGELNGNSVYFKQKASTRQFVIDPRNIEYIDIAGVGMFKTYNVELPLFDGVSYTPRLANVFALLKIVYSGVPYSLLEATLGKARTYFYEDTATKQPILWRYGLEYDEDDKRYYMIADYTGQLQNLALTKRVKIPSYYQLKRNHCYHEDCLIAVTKVLNQDSGFTENTAPQLLPTTRPRWAVSLRTGFCLQRVNYDYPSLTGPTHEIVFAREFHDYFKEWFFNVGLAFCVWQGATSTRFSNKPLKLRSDEYSIKPYVMGALRVPKDWFNRPAYVGMRLGSSFFARAYDKLSFDGHVGSSGTTKRQLYFSTEFNANVMLSRNFSLEVALGIAEFDEGTRPFIVSGLSYRWR